MEELITNIANFIKLVFDFLTNFLEGLADFLSLVVSAPSFLVEAVAYLPGVLSVFAVSMISVLIIKVVVNR